MAYAKKIAAGAAATIVVLGVTLNEIKSARIIGEMKNDIVSNELKITQLQKVVSNKEDEIKRISSLAEDANLKIELMENNINDTLKDYEKEINKKVVYNSNDLNVVSNATTTKLEKVLEGTSLEGLGYAYKQAEKEYGVNALFLIGLTAHESGWGKSRRATENNNLSGFSVYNDSSQGASFKTKFDCIMRTARLIKQDYLSKEGKHHRGASVAAVSKMYVDGNDEVNQEWCNSINSIANDLKEKLN